MHFAATIYADGKNVLDSVRYEMEHVTNEMSEDYGNIYVNVYDDTNLSFMGSTLLDSWEIDFAKFPDVNLVRTHVQLSGKGRFISGEFINRDEKRYELSNIIWVFRLMNGR